MSSSAQLLSAAVKWLHGRISSDPRVGPELFAQLFEAERALGLLHDERPISPFLRPYLLPRTQYEAIGQAARTLAGAFERLARAALLDERLLSELGLTEREARMARIDPGYTRLCVSSRLDAYLSEDGFKFLEYNAESPAGIADQMQMERVLYGLPYMREFLDRFATWRPEPHRRLLEVLMEAYREWGGEEANPQIAIVDWAGVSTETEFFVLKDFFEAAGYTTRIADPRSLSYDGETLSADGFRVDILYKRVIIHEFLQKFDETHPLSRAYADQKVCMANSFRTKLAHKKAGFAILSDPDYEYLFTRDELDCIRKHIPWTRIVKRGRATYEGVEYDLLDFVRRERERLVLKPSDDYGGHGIHIGWETAPDDWERAIEHALTLPFVVQERAPVGKVSLPMFDLEAVTNAELLVDFDPFLFHNEVEGGLVRLSASSLCNVSSGGGEAALLILENA
ncbi:MAG TPA: hypothetical protein VGB17_18760 [Pyrinomonadaceae bacterium]|jgi:glutathionylspermidine synthase